MTSRFPPAINKKIDPGDLLYIRLPQRQAPGRAIDTTDVADLQRDLGRTRITVDKSGYLHLPNYGHFNVNGKTPEQVRQSIRETLPRYLQELKMVQVSIVEKQHFVEVLGHVSSPGTYNVLEQANIQKVVDTAGGAVDGANLSLVKIMRQRGDEKHTVMVNLYQYTITGDIRLLPPPCRPRTPCLSPFPPVSGISSGPLRPGIPRKKSSRRTPARKSAFSGRSTIPGSTKSRKTT